jgi:NADH-quinone oxidoreductase subunit N
MTRADYIALLPGLVLAVTPIILMLALAFVRSHRLSFGITLAGLVAALAMMPVVNSFTCAGGVNHFGIESLWPLSGHACVLQTPFKVTVKPEAPPGEPLDALYVVDGYALLFTSLIIAAAIAVTLLSYSYFKRRSPLPEEFYILLLLSTLGATILVVAEHFASFFLGLELLSVPLYAMIAYLRRSDVNVEAGMKYLVLAGSSSAFLLFGMALVYAELHEMQFSKIAIAAREQWAAASSAGGRGTPYVLLAGVGMVLVGVGFKLALVPFHLWTPDVYQGAPAPVAAFIATISKGAMFALLLRLMREMNLASGPAIGTFFWLLAVMSMFGGNLLALLQTNVKRLLAYSSISHLGYLLVALLATGVASGGGNAGEAPSYQTAVWAVVFYVIAYFVTMLGAFGVVTVLSRPDRDADTMDDYRGLAYRRPWLAGVFTAMLLSLAGIPLTAGFIGKFYVLAAGAGAGLWSLVVILVINSAIGLYYYLRVIVAMYMSQPAGAQEAGGAGSFDAGAPATSFAAGLVLAGLTLCLVWLGVYPAGALAVIEAMVGKF